MDDSQILAVLRDLRKRFSEIHRTGVNSLRVGDLTRFGDSIRREREIIDEQQRIIDEYLEALNLRPSQPRG